MEDAQRVDQTIQMSVGISIAVQMNETVRITVPTSMTGQIKGVEEVHLSATQSISVWVAVTVATIEERLEELDEKKKAQTQFPAWVRPSMVNRIKSLNCFELVREYILEGMPIIEIARKIHALGEMQKLKVESIRQFLQHYQATIPAWQFQARNQISPEVLEPQKKERLDEIEEYEKLYRWTCRRVESGMKKEETLGINMDSVTSCIKLASDILDRSIKAKKEMKSIESLRPQVRRNASQATDWGKVYQSESVAKVMENAQSRNNIVTSLERLFNHGVHLADSESAPEAPPALPDQTIEENEKE